MQTFKPTVGAQVVGIFRLNRRPVRSVVVQSKRPVTLEKGSAGSGEFGLLRLDVPPPESAVGRGTSNRPGGPGARQGGGAMHCPVAFRQCIGLGLSRRLGGKGVPAPAFSARCPQGLLPRMGHRGRAPQARLLQDVREDRQRVLLRRHPASQVGRGPLVVTTQSWSRRRPRISSRSRATATADA